MNSISIIGAGISGLTLGNILKKLNIEWEKATFFYNFLMKSVPNSINQRLAEKIIQLEM